MSMLISCEEARGLTGRKEVRFADCRFHMGSPGKGIADYQREHIEGAVYFDLNEDLSGPVRKTGGRHPLPDLPLFQKKLEERGIGADTFVIAYDDGGDPYAARLVWLLKFLGHEKAVILNGGLTGWKEAGYPLTAKVPDAQKAAFPIRKNPGIFADYEYVQNIVSDGGDSAVLIDSREEKRYLGLEEPIDHTAGRIPGAIHKNWTDSFQGAFFKPASGQQERFGELDKDTEIIVYCGSGVTAAPNYLALKEAGFPNVKLYLGSYSDWISHPESKTAQGRGN